MYQSHIGIRLSSAEARELVLVIAPNRNAWQNGRIEQIDLFIFANSTCRLFGILDSVLEKELLNVKKINEFKDIALFK